MTVASKNVLDINPIEVGQFSRTQWKEYLNAEGAEGASNSQSSKAADTDLHLVELTLNGDKKAFDMLVIKYQTRISRLVSHYIHDFDAVRDVVQESFIRAYKALSSFRRESKFYTWLYRIAINTSHNYIKSNKNWFTRMESMEDNSEASNAESQYLNPERSYQNDDLRRGIQQAVTQLPLDLRSVLMLREVEGLNYEQIAEIVGCEIGTVKSRIFRARKRIVEKTSHLYE